MDQPRGETATVTVDVGDARALPRPPLVRQPGYLRRIFGEPQPVLDELREAYGPVVGLGGGPVRMAIVGGPTALHELFRMPVDAFRWGHKLNVLGFVVGEGSMIVSDANQPTTPLVGSVGVQSATPEPVDPDDRRAHR